MTVRRFRYCIDLAAYRPPTDTEGNIDHVDGYIVRPPTTDDVPRLAALMLDAYRDTIDYEGEELPDAIEAMEDVLQGEPRLADSRIAMAGDIAASAVLARDYEGAPFISYVITAPAYQRQGICRSLVHGTLSSMKQGGGTSVYLAITEGNLASEGLFRSLGAFVDHPARDE